LEEIAAIDQNFDERRPQPQRFVEKLKGTCIVPEIAQNKAAGA